MAMNLFGQPRRKTFNLFDEEDQPGIRLPNLAPRFEIPPVEEDQDRGYTREILDLLGKPRPAMSDYKSQLTDMPNPQDYQPGKMGRLAAALVGGATGFQNPAYGVQAARQITRGPYEQALGEFNNKLGIRRELAKLEEGTIDDQIKALSEARSMGLNYDKFKLEQLKEQRARELGEGNLEVAKGNLKVNEQNAGTNFANAQTNRSRLGETMRQNDRTFGLRQREVATGETNAQTNAANSRSLATYRDVMGKAATTRAEKSGRMGANQSAYQQTKATDLALSMLYRDKRFGKYIKIGSSSDPEPYVLAQDDGSPIYQELRRELKRRITGILQSGTPFPDESDDGMEQDDDVIDLSETGVPARRGRR